MAIGPLRLAALLTSILVGVGAGLVAADLRGDDPQSEPPTSASDSDPLGLDADMVNQPCADGALLVVGYGNTRPVLRSAIAQNDGARYLATAGSCGTQWALVDQPTPKYVVYLGPMPAHDACEQRMTTEHRGDFVTALNEGNTILVKCGCELDPADLPVLTPGMQPTELDVMWINQLQGMLYDTDRLTKEQLTTAYDPATVAAIEELQRNNAREVDGVTDPDTWKMVTDRACETYDY